MIDLKLTDAGDIEFFNNDIKLVGSDSLITQVVRNVLLTRDDWLTYPNISPNIIENMCEINDRYNGELLAKKVQNKLEDLHIVRSGQIKVTPVPVDLETLLLRIQLPTINIGVTIDIKSNSIDVTTIDNVSSRIVANPRVSVPTCSFINRNR